MGRKRPGNTGRKKADIAHSINGQIKPSNQNKFNLLALYHNVGIIDFQINIKNCAS
jgi:hypothetical protein